MSELPPAAAPAARKYSLALRIWHWANSFVVSALLTSIFVLFVVLKMKEVGPKFQEVLQKEGVTMSLEQIRGLTRIVSHKVWDWHIYFGVTLAVLLALRIVTEIAQARSQRFAHRLKQAKGQSAEGQPFRLQKSALVKYSYLAFYLMLVVMVVTGLGLIYADDVPFLEELEHTIEEVHNFTMYLVMGFIVVHVVGVVWAELHKDRGIVSDMINGGEPRT
ncbi:cytochrome b/b6 domain-containing protein [Hymenobacter koreensis]|uniref:Cytochrome b561 bacterial/Ni-hydrogenase domain-containing protein n=1 Tax=Hymenobacter koreensis TaxID=1084523 RepID=A0ABP8ITQ6_9BACT